MDGVILECIFNEFLILFVYFNRKEIKKKVFILSKKKKKLNKDLNNKNKSLMI